MSCGRNAKVEVEPPPAPTPPPAGAATGSGSPFQSWTPGPGQSRPQANRKTGRAGRGLGGCLVVIILAVVGLSVGVVMLVGSVSETVEQATGGVFGGSLSPAGSDLLLVSESPVEVVTAAYDGRADTRSLARLRLGVDGGEGEVVWRSEVFPAGVYGGPVAMSGETLFAAIGEELWAVDVTTGVVAWKADLPDVVHSSCATCFVVQGDSLVLQTADAQILSFGTGSSEARWGYRLASPSGLAILSGAGLAVVDDSPDQPGDRHVRVLDPATGAAVSTYIPACDDGTGSIRELSFTDQVYAVPDSPDLVATVSFGSGCAVRWNGTTGQVVWSAPVGDIASSARGAGLVSGDRLVLAGGTGLTSIQLASGAVTSMPAPPDTSVEPVSRQGDLLLAQSSTSRGTTRVGLVGYDVATGQMRWHVPVPGEGELLDVGTGSSDALFSGSPRTALVAVGDTVSLATFDGDDRSLTIRTVDASSGELGEPEVTKLDPRPGTASVSVHEVTEDGLLFGIDNKVVFVHRDDGMAIYPG